MHQQCPERSQVNAVPQRGQFNARCAAEFAGAFVTMPFTILSNPSCDVQSGNEHSPDHRRSIGPCAGEHNREISAWRATRKALSSH
jgi:hypothetical protein